MDRNVAISPLELAMRSQKDKARDFRELHHGKRILILPNAWDVPSARVFENEGFPAVATSSAGLMVSLGYPDGEVMGRDEFVSAVKRIARILAVPLSVDIVAGFGKTTKEVVATVRAILKAGGIGINIVDFRSRNEDTLSRRETDRECQSDQKTRRYCRSSSRSQRSDRRATIWNR